MFTLNTAINYINQALNYPSAIFDDLKLFFDQAISEINTNLHIGIKNIDTLIDENRKNFNNLKNIVILGDPIPSFIPAYSSEPTTTGTLFYYNTTTKKFGKRIGGTEKPFEYFDTLYGVQSTGIEVSVYKAVAFTDNAIWVADASENPYDLNLENYLPNDWIILFVIPYICFKYSVRDGNPMSIFMEDASQGFQQLNSCYDVPEESCLLKMAGHPAYTVDVEKHLDNLKILVPTRAITEDMRIPRDIPFEANEFYHNGGFGI